MNLSGEVFAFIVLALFSVLGGVLLLHLTKVIHMLLALALSFMSIAGIYVLLSAEFIAVVQVLIVSGAVIILLFLSIMLPKYYEGSASAKTSRWKQAILLISIMGFAYAVYIGIYHLNIPVLSSNLDESNTKKVGVELFSIQVIPFALISILLFVAIRGSIILAKKDNVVEGVDQS